MRPPKEFNEVIARHPDGLVVVDRKKTVLFANSAAESLLGRRLKEMAGKPFKIPFKENAVEEARIAGTGRPVRFAEIHAVAVEWRKKSASLITLRDITRRKRDQDEMNQTLKNLQFALASEKVLLEELDKKNKKLIELSTTDGLTGLFNHRYVEERLEFEFERARRQATPLSCLLMDIDHFKNVNDTYGHPFGDLVLRRIGKILLDTSRKVDICGRYGGEEFIVLAHLPVESAVKFANRIHEAVERTRFTAGKKTVRVTVSIGVAEFSQELRDRRMLVERADQALYRAKRDGRNLIRRWMEAGAAEGKILDNYSIDELKTSVVDLSKQIKDAYLESTFALLKAVDAKDHYTLAHSQKVADISVRIARTLSLPPAEVEVIRYAGLLHDIGKIGIHQKLLRKNGRLSEDERNIVRRYPEIGIQILKDVKFLEKEVPIILHHHERFDGNGYPHGLKGREIPLGARILAVADAYDAMTTDRAFKKRMSAAQAISELKKCSGAHFDPEIVNAFVDHWREEP